MPNIVTWIQKSRERPREFVSQVGATPATIAYLRPFKIAKVALTGVTVNNFNAAWQNPETNAILVTRLIVDITTAGGTPTATLNIGPAITAITQSVLMINALDANAAAVTDHCLVAGAGAGGVHKLDENGGTTAWITCRSLTETTINIVGNIYIFYTEI